MARQYAEFPLVDYSASATNFNQGLQTAINARREEETEKRTKLLELNTIAQNLPDKRAYLDAKQNQLYKQQEFASGIQIVVDQFNLAESRNDKIAMITASKMLDTMTGRDPDALLGQDGGAGALLARELTSQLGLTDLVDSIHEVVSVTPVSDGMTIKDAYDLADSEPAALAAITKGATQASQMMLAKTNPDRFYYGGGKLHGKDVAQAVNFAESYAITMVKNGQMTPEEALLRVNDMKNGIVTASNMKETLKPMLDELKISAPATWQEAEGYRLALPFYNAAKGLDTLGGADITTSERINFLGVAGVITRAHIADPVNAPMILEKISVAKNAKGAVDIPLFSQQVEAATKLYKRDAKLGEALVTRTDNDSWVSHADGYVKAADNFGPEFAAGFTSPETLSNFNAAAKDEPSKMVLKSLPTGGSRYDNPAALASDMAYVAPGVRAKGALTEELAAFPDIASRVPVSSTVWQTAVELNEKLKQTEPDAEKRGAQIAKEMGYLYGAEQRFADKSAVIRSMAFEYAKLFDGARNVPVIPTQETTPETVFMDSTKTSGSGGGTFVDKGGTGTDKEHRETRTWDKATIDTTAATFARGLNTAAYSTQLNEAYLTLVGKYGGNDLKTAINQFVEEGYGPGNTNEDNVRKAAIKSHLLAKYKAEEDAAYASAMDTAFTKVGDAGGTAAVKYLAPGVAKSIEAEFTFTPVNDQKGNLLGYQVVSSLDPNTQYQPVNLSKERAISGRERIENASALTKESGIPIVSGSGLERVVNEKSEEDTRPRISSPIPGEAGANAFQKSLALCFSGDYKRVYGEDADPLAIAEDSQAIMKRTLAVPESRWYNFLSDSVVSDETTAHLRASAVLGGSPAMNVKLAQAGATHAYDVIRSIDTAPEYETYRAKLANNNEARQAFDLLGMTMDIIRNNPKETWSQASGGIAIIAAEIVKQDPTRFGEFSASLPNRLVDQIDTAFDELPGILGIERSNIIIGDMSAKTILGGRSDIADSVTVRSMMFSADPAPVGSYATEFTEARPPLATRPTTAGGDRVIYWNDSEKDNEKLGGKYSTVTVGTGTIAPISFKAFQYNP